MIRLVTDSASMIPAALRERLSVIVVPMTVTIDDDEHLEGVDLASAEFYDRLASGATVTTAAPSPGAFLAAYEGAARDGADELLSIHTGSNYSAAVSAATLAAELADLPVTIVDTGLASFPVSLCVWTAADMLAAHNPIEIAADAARLTAAQTGSVFVVGVPALARRGGRFAAVSGEIAPTSILVLDGDDVRELQRVDDLGSAVDAMSSHAREIAAAHPVRIGIGHAQRPILAAALADRLAGAPGIQDLVHYEVGPSVGAHTGAGTVGIVYAPEPTATFLGPAV